MRVLTVGESRELDRRATAEFGVPSLLLMENAAIGVADAICETYPDLESVAIFCGPGNNGGDGLAVGRHLDRRGYAVTLVLVGDRGREGDAKLQETICRRQELPFEEWGSEEDAFESALTYDLAVDAMFGVGLTRALGGVFRAAAETIAARGAPCVAVDLPSGLAGDSAHPLGVHVTADLTVTFETLKPAHVLTPACEAAGELAVADLGISAAISESLPCSLYLTTFDDARDWLPKRPETAHKGTFGHVLVAAGSPGFAGAAVLAARGAIRAGAGLVTCAVPETLLSTVDAASLESMTLALPPGAHGGIGAEAASVLIDAAADRSVLAIGPGVGSHAETRGAVRRVVLEAAVPVVLDASGLDAFATEPEALRERAASTILTPHPGELARLLDREIDAIVEDRLAAVREAAERADAVVVLKGSRTLTATPDGRVHVNSTGNPGMGTGGTGDVLTGTIAALLAQGLTPETAATLGVFVHGLAGDLAAEECGETALTAGDLLHALPIAVREVEAG